MVKEKALIPLIPIDWFYPSFMVLGFLDFRSFLAEIRDTFISIYGSLPVHDHVKVGLGGR